MKFSDGWVNNWWASEIDGSCLMWLLKVDEKCVFSFFFFLHLSLSLCLSHIHISEHLFSNETGLYVYNQNRLIVLGINSLYNSHYILPQNVTQHIIAVIKIFYTWYPVQTQLGGGKIFMFSKNVSVLTFTLT